MLANITCGKKQLTGYTLLSPPKRAHDGATRTLHVRCYVCVSRRCRNSIIGRVNIMDAVANGDFYLSINGGKHGSRGISRSRRTLPDKHPA